MKRALVLVAFPAALLAAGCGDGDRTATEHGVLQTKAPGHVTAGGSTSGQVIAARGGVPSPAPAGTPGIPLGAGGNTGGTLPGAAVNQGGPPVAVSASSPSPGMSEEQLKALQLAAAQDAAVAHWRSRAATRASQAAPAPAAAAPPVIRSEKLGTAPPSEDVKKAVKPPTDPGVGARAPDAAN